MATVAAVAASSQAIARQALDLIDVRYEVLPHVLDGEAAKVGGMAVCRQLKQEIYDCPPALVLTGRPQDAWLATWSLADGHVAAPYDPMELQQAVAALLTGS